MPPELKEAATAFVKLRGVNTFLIIIRNPMTLQWGVGRSALSVRWVVRGLSQD